VPLYLAGRAANSRPPANAPAACASHVLPTCPPAQHPCPQRSLPQHCAPHVPLPPSGLPPQVRGQRALLALSTRPFLGYSDQGRFSLTPLSYEALEHASSFASDQCPEGLVSIVKSTLRILMVENVGEAFNQQVGVVGEDGGGLLVRQCMVAGTSRGVLEQVGVTFVVLSAPLWGMTQQAEACYVGACGLPMRGFPAEHLPAHLLRPAEHLPAHAPPPCRSAG
jgi:hypothetical protein